MLPTLTTLLALLLALCALCAPTSAADIEQEWIISYRFVSPDGVEKLVPVVNGQYPGPQLRGHVGQTVRIVVRNALVTDTTSIHWHGIKQTGTVWSDGVPGVTQCAIGPGESFTYQFKLDAPGTLWWHSHSGLQKSSLYGAIVITGDRARLPKYDAERTLLLNDWYHTSQTEQAAGLLDPNFRWVGNPDALLINGRGTFDCADTSTCDPDHPDAGPFIMHVRPDTTYRLRLVGASSLTFLNFGIERHRLTVIEAETTPLKPIDVRFLDIGSGQSYSVLLRTKSEEELRSMNNSNGNFWMQLSMRHREPGPAAHAVLRYIMPSTEDALPPRPVPASPAWDDVDWSLRQVRRLRSLDVVEMPPATREFTMLGTQNRLGSEAGRLVWAVNNISYVEPPTPVLHSVKLGVEQDTAQYVEQGTIPTVFNYSQSLTENGLTIISKGGTHVIKMKKDEVVDFVFQNTVALNGAEEIHPWHLHLHNFWTLGYGDHRSTWTPEDRSKYRPRRAVSRNTFTLYPLSWTAIRVKMDNAGIAHFHCHILPHLVMGMGFVVQIGEPDEMPAPPAGTQFCGTVSKLVGPPVRNPFVYGGCAA